MAASETQIISTNTLSDGDPIHLPKTEAYWQEEPPTIYLEKLASLWMDHRSEMRQGVRYVLDKLPDGYSVWAKRRPKNDRVIDRWLYGHPDHKTFDSPNRFFPHFLHLMEHGSRIGCSCTVCWGTGSKVLPLGQAKLRTLPPSAPKPRGRPRINEPQPPLDAEGTPDIYRTLLNRLQRDGSVDTLIEEPMSLEWRVEHDNLRQSMEAFQGQPSWVPRLGELVLFVRSIESSCVIRRDQAGVHRVFNLRSQQWGTRPSWEAGVVTQVPQGTVQVQELIEPPDRSFQVNYSGFRVEPMSDPNSDQKPYSRQYKYVALFQMRPFSLLEEVLKTTEPRDRDKEDLHPTIRNARLIVATFTLVAKYRFKGTWPTAEILCKGIYVGPELLVTGDLVRLTPTSGSEVSDILSISAIKLMFSNLNEASNDDQSDGHPYNSVINIIGKGYTKDVRRAVQGCQPVRPNSGLIPGDAHDFGEWYPLQETGKSLQMPFRRVLGRCFAAQAMQLWFSAPAAPDNNSPTVSALLSTGLQQTFRDREYACKYDRRLARNGQSWLWTDTRAEALDLDTLNGVETARHDKSRDPKRWVRYVKELEGLAGPEDKAALERDAEKTRRSFGGAGSQGSLVQSALALPQKGTSDEESSGPEEGESTEEDERASKRRSSAVRTNRAPSKEIVRIDGPSDDPADGASGLGSYDSDEGLDAGDGRVRRRAREQWEAESSAGEDNDVVMLEKFHARN
jgi:hypothetical protein